MLVCSLARTRGAFRGQRTLLFFAALAPLLGSFIYVTVVSPILFKHHIWLFLENQNTIYGGHFLKNFA
jgi:hypothetical protein